MDHTNKAVASLLLLTFGLFTPIATAATARVVNQCGSTIYLASVGQSKSAGMQPLDSSYSEAMTGVGVSIKVSPSNGGTVTQFEYSHDTASGQLTYDTSNIDGNPFAQQGTRLVPSKEGAEGFPSCVTVDCPPGESCSAAYNNPDDVRSMVCPIDSDLTFYVCTGAKLSGGSGTGASSSAAGGGSGVKSSSAAPVASTQAAAKGKQSSKAVTTSKANQVQSQTAAAGKTKNAQQTTAAAGRSKGHQRRERSRFIGDGETMAMLDLQSDCAGVMITQTLPRSV